MRSSVSPTRCVQGRLERANRRGNGCALAVPSRRQRQLLSFDAPGRAVSYLQPAAQPIHTQSDRERERDREGAQRCGETERVRRQAAQPSRSVSRHVAAEREGRRETEHGEDRESERHREDTQSDGERERVSGSAPAVEVESIDLTVCSQETDTQREKAGEQGLQTAAVERSLSYSTVGRDRERKGTPGPASERIERENQGQAEERARESRAARGGSEHTHTSGKIELARRADWSPLETEAGPGSARLPTQTNDSEEEEEEEDSEEFQVWSQSLRDDESDSESESDSDGDGEIRSTRARKRRAVPIESSSDSGSDSGAQQCRAVVVESGSSESDDDFETEELRRSSLRRDTDSAAAVAALIARSADDGEGVDPEDATEDLGIPPFLDEHMRPHQIIGVRFMHRCVCGFRNPGQFGCVLADEMGLGKTLQAVALSWISLKQGFPKPGLPGQADPCSRIIVICPTSLIMNWYNEFSKWCGNRLFVMCVSGEGRQVTQSTIARFRGDGSPRVQPGASARAADDTLTRRTRTLPAWMRDPQVLILSYESARLYAADLQGADSSYCCDMLILDEAHRLKNELSQSRQVLARLPCKRRVLLTGTPMQNRMEEWFSVFDFANKDVLGTSGQFMKKFVKPIQQGREPGASQKAKKVLQELSSELARLKKRYFLARPNAILAKLLPPRLTQIVVCRLTELQIKLYERVLRSNHARSAIAEGGQGALRNIKLLQQLCNHPKVVYDSECAGAASSSVFTRSDFPASFGHRSALRQNESSATVDSDRVPARPAQQGVANVYIQAVDGRYVSVDDKGKLVLKSGTVGAAGTFVMKAYGSKTFQNRISLSNSTFQGITQFARADTAISRTLRVGKKCSTWESFEPRRCAQGHAFTVWTHHGRAWRCVGDEIKADDSTGVGAALQFKFILTACVDGAPTAPTGAAAGSSPAGLPITARAMTSFINGSVMPELAPNLNSARTADAGSEPPLSKCLLEFSSKMVLVHKMLKVLRAETSERVVIVAQRTKTLDVLQDLCEEHGYEWRRVDGSTPVSRRQDRVNELNNPSSNVFVFLLSAKAGGAGLNLIGANRLVLFDPDWNPATDDQAAARIWRDGQQRQVFIYRLVCTGTIEEKILQRQISKHGLHGTVTDNPDPSKFSTSELSDIFTLRRDTASETHEKVCKCATCKECAPDGRDVNVPAANTDDEEQDGDDDAVSSEQVQVGEPGTVELRDWSHHHDVATTSDALLRTCAGADNIVSLVFACLRKGRDPTLPSFGDAADPNAQVSDDDDDDDDDEHSTDAEENNLTDRRKGRCHHCGRDGHWRFECPTLVPRLHKQLEARHPFRRVSVVILVGTLSLSPSGSLSTVGQTVSPQYGRRTRLLRELIRMGGGHIYAKLQPPGSAHATTHVIVGRTTTAAQVFAAARHELGATKADLTRPGLVVVTADWVSDSVRQGTLAAVRPWLAVPDRKSRKEKWGSAGSLRPSPPKVEDTCRDVLVAIVNTIEARAELRSKPTAGAFALGRKRGRGRGWWNRGRGRGRGYGRSRSRRGRGDSRGGAEASAD